MKRCLTICLFFIIMHTRERVAGKELYDNGNKTAQNGFDFGDCEDREGNTSALPLQLTVKYDSVRQVGNDSRWIKQGPSLYMIFNYTASTGQVFFEGNCGYNSAYRIEHDPGSCIRGNEFFCSIRELYWKKAFRKCTLTAGNAIASWTVADLLPVTDKMVVYDRSEYLFSDIEDVTTGQNIIRIEYYQEHFKVGALLVPYPLFDSFQDGDHPYSVTPGIDIENRDSRTPEYASYIAYMTGKLQFKFINGYVNNRLANLQAVYDGSDIVIHKKYDRYFFSGLLFEYACDPVLLKYEMVYNNSFPMQVSGSGIVAGQRKTDCVDSMAGIDINIGQWGTLTGELSLRYLPERNRALVNNRNVYTGAVSWSGSFLSDMLGINVVIIFPESVTNRVVRTSAGYDISNNVSLKLQYTAIVIEKKKETYNYMNNYDRIDVSVKYGFSLD